MSANLSLTPYTVHVTYGEAVQFLTSLAEQGSEYTTMATAPLISWLFPDFAGECLQARDTIIHVARPLLQEMTRHRLPLPESANRPADDTPLQLQLSAGSCWLSSARCASTPGRALSTCSKSRSSARAKWPE